MATKRVSGGQVTIDVTDTERKRLRAAADVLSDLAVLGIDKASETSAAVLEVLDSLPQGETEAVE